MNERFNESCNEQTDLYGKLLRLEWLMRRCSMAGHRKHGPMGDPHRGQGRILSLLKLRPEISQRDLCYLLDMRPQSLGELLNKLERSGYITRTISDADRRAMIVRLTPEGEKASEQQAELDMMFNIFTDGELIQLEGYIDRLIEKLETLVEAYPNDRPNPFERHEAALENMVRSWAKKIGEMDQDEFLKWIGEVGSMSTKQFMHWANELGGMSQARFIAWAEQMRKYRKDFDPRVFSGEHKGCACNKDEQKSGGGECRCDTCTPSEAQDSGGDNKPE